MNSISENQDTRGKGGRQPVLRPQHDLVLSLIQGTCAWETASTASPLWLRIALQRLS